MLEDDARINSKCSYLENSVELLESKLSHLDQFDRRNHLVLSGIPNTVNDVDPGITVTSLLSDTDVNLEPHDTKDCHRIGLTDKNNLKKTLLFN